MEESSVQQGPHFKLPTPELTGTKKGKMDFVDEKGNKLFSVTVKKELSEMDKFKEGFSFSKNWEKITVDGEELYVNINSIAKRSHIQKEKIIAKEGTVIENLKKTYAGIAENKDVLEKHPSFYEGEVGNKYDSDLKSRTSTYLVYKNTKEEEYKLRCWSDQEGGVVEHPIFITDQGFMINGRNYETIREAVIWTMAKVRGGECAPLGTVREVKGQRSFLALDRDSLKNEKKGWSFIDHTTAGLTKRLEQTESILEQQSPGTYFIRDYDALPDRGNRFVLSQKTGSKRLTHCEFAILADGRFLAISKDVKGYDQDPDIYNSFKDFLAGCLHVSGSKPLDLTSKEQ